MARKYTKLPPKSGKTQVRQQQTLEIPGEQAGYPDQQWPGQWLLLLSTGPPEDVGRVVLATACFPRGLGRSLRRGFEPQCRNLSLTSELTTTIPTA